MSDIGKNAIRLNRLIDMGAVWPELIEEMATELDGQDAPHFICFFQLPYPLHIASGWHRVRGSREDRQRYVSFQARLARIQVDDFARLRVKPNEDNDTEGTLFTQMLALVPLWEPRSKYYPAYKKCVVDEDLKHAVIVPAPQSWATDHRAMTAADYEFNAMRRFTRLISTGLIFFLPAYSISSLTEAPVPEQLDNLFCMPAPGRVIFNRPPQPLLKGLLQSNAATRLSTVTSKQLQVALSTGARVFGKFEHQLFAMNRLRLEGEKAMALVGTLSLLEWHLNLHFPLDTGRSESVARLLKAGRLEFLAEADKATLADASKLRNGLVHGSPPTRYNLTVPNASAGREEEYHGNAISSEKVAHVISTALAVYRQSNLKRNGHL